MAFDVFKLRDRVVGEYKDYVESFVHIYDKEIERFVQAKLDEGELWPDAVLQLNPAYEPGGTLGELAAKGELHWGTARFFGEDLRLYRHQEEAIRAAARGGPVITSTGTGSGKSLTYLVPIVDRDVAAVPGGIAAAEEDDLLMAVNEWIVEQGLPEGEFLYELTDRHSGDAVAVFDLAWPDGLQEGLSEPVALLIDEPPEIHDAANRAGFRFFTDVETFRAYVDQEILASEEAERPAA